MVEEIASVEDLISVVVPVYNVEKYLENCVDSLLNQTYANLEIVLVDDGSTDGSGSLCDKCVERDPRIAVFHKTNGGLSSARNYGIEKARGELIVFIDSDDYIAADTIEQLYHTMTLAGADISIISLTSSSELDSGITDKFKSYNSEQAIKEILLERAFSTSACGKLFKRGLFDNVRFPEGKIYEDYATVYKTFLAAKKIAFADTFKYFYVTNLSSITKSRFSEKRLQYFEVSDTVISDVAESYPRLKKHATRRATRYAISFYKQFSESGCDNADVQKFLISRIRKRFFSYLFSRYSFKSKLYGLCVCISPKLAYRVFNRKKAPSDKSDKGNGNE